MIDYNTIKLDNAIFMELLKKVQNMPLHKNDFEIGRYKFSFRYATVMLEKADKDYNYNDYATNFPRISPEAKNVKALVFDIWGFTDTFVTQAQFTTYKNGCVLILLPERDKKSITPFIETLKTFL